VYSSSNEILTGYFYSEFANSVLVRWKSLISGIGWIVRLSVNKLPVIYNVFCFHFDDISKYQNWWQDHTCWNLHLFSLCKGLIWPTFQCHRGKILKFVLYINVLAHYRSQVCDLTYFSRLQTACPQPLPGNEVLKTCNVTQFFTVAYPSVAHILLTQSYPVHHLRWTFFPYNSLYGVHHPRGPYITSSYF
jgi:hypothetical protein